MSNSSTMVRAVEGATASGGVAFSSPQTIKTASFNPVFLDIKLKEEAARISGFGLSLNYIQTIAREDPQFDRALREQLLDDGFEEPEVLTLADGVREAIGRSGVRSLSYIQAILQSGQFLTICPASGRPVKSDGSFAIDGHHLAYRFTGDVVFYLIVGRFHGRRAALCIPSCNLLVTLDVPERGLSISRWVADSMRRMLTHSVAEPNSFAHIGYSNVGLTLVIGGMPNLGHHIWQELSGIEQLITDGYLPRVRSLLIGPHTWFRIEEVFPELAGLPTVRCATVEDMLTGGLSQPNALVRPIGLQITPALRSRLRASAESATGAGEAIRIADAGAKSRLVWINLRAHNKMWLQQVDGYAALLNALQDEYGNIGVVYDGWSDTASIRDEIGRRLGSGITKHDTLGASMETSLLWAGAVSVYVSVVGSGLVLNSWLTQKPGVAHANRAHLNQRSFWNCVSQEMIPTVFIDNQNVTDDGSLYGNYNLDWRILLTEIRKTLGPSRHPAIGPSGSSDCSSAN